MNNVVVIGSGQAGLSMSYWLQQRGIQHLVLEAHARIGDNWRRRWDSLHLFSPAAYNNLPGLPFPGPRKTLPSKDMAADYLEGYARHFNLPVQASTRVSSLTRTDDGYQLATTSGQIPARNVVVATGPFTVPRIPPIRDQIPPQILQLHTRDYQNPRQLPIVPTLVVGAGASGSQVARELAADRKVWLAGRDPGTLPRSILGLDIYWWLYKTGLITVRWDSRIGRKRLAFADKGDAHVGPKLEKMARKAGIIRLGKLQAAEGNELRFESGERISEVEAIVWATGYRQHYDWIKLPVFESSGLPRHRRGVVEEAAGLYFLGLKTLYRFNSSLMGGVGRDAEYLAQKIAERG